MKRLAAIALVLALSACQGDVPPFVHGRVMVDGEGCAWLARRGAGDVVFLIIVRQQSAPTCTFKGES